MTVTYSSDAITHTHRRFLDLWVSLKERKKRAQWPLPYLRQHGTTHEEQKIEALIVSKEGVPDTDDIWQQELLGQEQRQPAKGKELGFDVLLLLSDMHQTKNEYPHKRCSPRFPPHFHPETALCCQAMLEHQQIHLLL